MLLAGFYFFSLPAYCQPSKEEAIPLLAKLGPGVYRGGQPSPEGYAQLKAMGIKTIVNFRNEKDEIDHGRQQAETYGMNYISIPWTIYGSPDWTVAQRFFSVMKDQRQYPVFLHCKRGVERTGVLSALYYMKYENLSSERAYHKAFEGYPMRLIWRPFVSRQFGYLKDKLQSS